MGESAGRRGRKWEKVWKEGCEGRGGSMGVSAEGRDRKCERKCGRKCGREEV